jgi:hypothetical protein
LGAANLKRGQALQHLHGGVEGQLQGIVLYLVALIA